MSEPKTDPSDPPPATFTEVAEVNQTQTSEVVQPNVAIETDQAENLFNSDEAMDDQEASDLQKTLDILDNTEGNNFSMINADPILEAITRSNSRAGGRGGKDDDDDDPFKNITLDDIGGLGIQIQWLKQCILKPLKDGSDQVFGFSPPKGVLFYGPPGTGKTLLARAFGNELSKELKKKIKFYHRKGSDSSSPWFGESSRILRELFNDAIKNKPSIIFFDELDGLCPSRDGNVGEGTRAVITSLLGLMDNLPRGEVFVIGATNRVDSIDAAMIRPGRFDKRLEFLPPDKEARKKILQINTEKWKRSKPQEAFLEDLGKRTIGFTGADLEKLARDAFFTAFERCVPDADLSKTINHLHVLSQDWNLALSKIKPNIAVFGSTLYVPRMPFPAVKNLIFKIQDDILDKIKPLIPKRSTTAINLGQMTDASHSFLSFVIITRGDFPETVDNLVIPGILTSSSLANLPVYLLSKEDILSDHDQIGHITKTIHQAINSFYPCILYVPMINELITEIPFHFNLLSNQLNMLRGKPVLLLATSSVDPLQFPTESNFRNIFAGIERSCLIRNPEQEECKEFFRPLFNHALNQLKGSAAVKKEQTKVIQGLLEETAIVAHLENINLILAFHDELIRALTTVAAEKNLIGELQTVVDNFSKNKLNMD